MLIWKIILYICGSALTTGVRIIKHHLSPGDHTEAGSYVGLSEPPDPVTWKTHFKVKAVCEDKLVVGLTMLVWAPNLRVFQRVWPCHGSANARLLHVQRARLTLDDDIAYRPSFLNRRPAVVDMAKVVVWLLEEETWSGIKLQQRHEAYKWSSVRESRVLRLLSPYSRPYPHPRHACPQWYWPLLLTPRRSDIGLCRLQHTTETLLDFPVALNGQTYGVRRHVTKFMEPDLESERIQGLTKPRVSIEMWLFIKEYCLLHHLNPAGACLLLGHTSHDESHHTPILLIDHLGRMQVEVAGPGMYVAKKTHYMVPKQQWVRILFSLRHRKWALEWSYGPGHQETVSTGDTFEKVPYFDETSGHFVIGGAEGRLGSILGYMARVRMYRGHVMTLQELSMPVLTDAMFTIVDVGQRETECAPFKQWLLARARYYISRLATKAARDGCPNSYEHLMTSRPDDVSQVCPQRPPMSDKGYKLLTPFLRRAVSRYHHVTSRVEALMARQLLQLVISVVGETGLIPADDLISMVTQASCLGEPDAMFALAAFLNNGLGTAVQTNRSLGLLMEGVLRQHRLSSLALGHRHAMALDGLPLDLDVAYMYYKDVGDRTREDRDQHPDHQVATETVRLIDEKQLEQQTDETGDLFLWLKQQAQQGVATAQMHLAHLYFWGSQGLQRNVRAARELFQQGAAQGDTDSLYSLAMMELHGRGGAQKNETSARERLRQAANKKHPYAIGALAWLALERDKNYSQAAVLFEEALSLDFIDAAFYLGHMYQWGLYPASPPDSDQAVALYLRAAVRGHMPAALMYAQFCSRGTATNTRNSQQAMLWARYIAEMNGDIGLVLRRGVKAYRDKNIPLAAYFYLLAAEAGPEVASFNLAWLCEERKQEVAAALGRECMWRHYNLTVQREEQYVDPYAYIKMGDYFWFGCQGHRDVIKAAGYYSAAARKHEPHALFNLALMVEEGAEVPQAVWRSLGFKYHQYYHNLTLLMELYHRCGESYKSEAFVPCTLALYRVWLLHLWTSYRLYLVTSTFVGSLVAVLGTSYVIARCWSRLRQHRHATLYRA